jgi:hypothetical protein
MLVDEWPKIRNPDGVRFHEFHAHSRRETLVAEISPQVAHPHADSKIVSPPSNLTQETPVEAALPASKPSACLR